jgi:aerobic-type carbon monoxide dehydrogenase small subunit (CoxS/CutS family)
MDETYAMTVNGQQRTVKSDSQRMLLDVLREDLQLTGTKYGCGEARCGACTVLVDGKRVYSCRTRIADADGKAVLTIEGLAQGDKLHRVQQAFLAENGFQCGFCTAGMIMSAVALLEETPSPSDAEIRSWMNRQMCRCCSYSSIVDAVRHAAGARS